MTDLTIRVRAVSLNSPRHRVRKSPKDGLWHVWRSGYHIAAYGAYENALRCATTGRVW